MLIRPVMPRTGPCGGKRGSVLDALRIGLARVASLSYSRVCAPFPLAMACVRHVRSPRSLTLTKASGCEAASTAQGDAAHQRGRRHSRHGVCDGCAAACSPYQLPLVRGRPAESLLERVRPAQRRAVDGRARQRAA